MPHAFVELHLVEPERELRVYLVSERMIQKKSLQRQTLVGMRHPERVQNPVFVGHPYRPLLVCAALQDRICILCHLVHLVHGHDLPEWES